MIGRVEGVFHVFYFRSHRSSLVTCAWALLGPWKRDAAASGGADPDLLNHTRTRGPSVARMRNFLPLPRLGHGATV